MEKQRIIGFSGRAESGKDTVARYIQYLTCNGTQRHNIEHYKFDKEVIESCSNWKIKKFSYKLKQVASLLTGISVEKFEDQEFKKSLLGSDWGTIGRINLNDIDPFKNIDFNVLMDVRTFLQKLGTDAIRDNLHEKTWINALWCDYTIEDNWLITDCRFRNEAESIRQHGGIVVRLTRNSDVVSNHVSETELDDYKFDYIIDNKNDTLEETYVKIKEFCYHYKLI